MIIPNNNNKQLWKNFLNSSVCALLIALLTAAQVGVGEVRALFRNEPNHGRAIFLMPSRHLSCSKHEKVLYFKEKRGVGEDFGFFKIPVFNFRYL